MSLQIRDWFSFSKRHNTKDVYTDDVPSSLKKWKNKFFLIDHRAISDHLTWRHSCSCVSDDLPSDGYDRNDNVIRSSKEISIYDFMTLPSWSDAKIAEESHHLSLPLLERVLSHTTASITKGAIILLPTPDEIAASLPDYRLVKKSKVGSSALELDQAEGTDKANLDDLCAEIEDSLERDEGVSMRVVSAPTPRLAKSLSFPWSYVVYGFLSVVASGCVGKSGAKVMRCQMDLLDCLACSALARDAEYDQIPDDDFGTVTRGVSSPLYTREEWNGPHASEHSILCKDIFKDLDVCRKALNRTITPAELRRTESLIPLKLSNRVNVLSALLGSHGYELNSHYANLVTSLDSKLENLQRGYDALGQENRELHSKKDAASEESLVRKLLSSDEFHASLARVASLGINYGVDRGLRIGRTDVEFEAAVQKVSNFHAGVKADFDKALVDFPTMPLPFSKIDAASGGTLSNVAQIFPYKFVHSTTSVSVAPSSVNEAPEQVSP
ncbi:hypothetical protein Tco_1046409 [Tanacetum coccineum]